MKSNRAVEYMMKNDHFSQWMDLKILAVEAGKVELSMQVRREMLNGFGILHGGVSFALADSAMAFAANAHGKLSVVTDAHIQFPESAKEGDILLATATETHRTRKMAFYEVHIRQKEDDLTIARYQGSAYITSKSNPPESE